MDRIYHFMLGHGADVRLVASLNGVPFFRAEPRDPPRTRSGLANHLLRPGHNDFEIEITRARASSAVVCSIIPDDDREHSAYDFSWLDAWQSVPVEQQRLPFVHRASFEVQGLTKGPAYLDAPPRDLDEREMAKVRDAVKRFHRALETRNIDAIVAEGSFKIDEFRRFYPNASAVSDTAIRRSFVELFDTKPVVRPLDDAQLHYRGCAGGRAVYVTGRAGSPALVAESDDAQLHRDLWLMPRGDRWQLFR